VVRHLGAAVAGRLDASHALDGPCRRPLDGPEAGGRLVAEPHGPRATPMRLTAERWGRVPRTYIECTQDRTIQVESQRLMQQMSPGASVVTLDADHSPYLSRPAELASALIGAIPPSHA